MSRITLNLKKFSRGDEHTGSGTLSWAVASRMIPRFFKESGRAGGGGYDTHGFGGTTTTGTTTGITNSGGCGVADTGLINTGVAATDAMEFGREKVSLDEEVECDQSKRDGDGDSINTDTASVGLYS
ncbi:hypothetical protein PQX77_022328 [Marasmius sp. AFHP31]|nr:hypothetical protein PQX77_022328 [Marasmius sp. AFHP31]